jgi:CxxC motif-containing protein (DUF1111 family)
MMIQEGPSPLVRVLAGLPLLAAVPSCAPDDGTLTAAVEAGEELPGGETTHEFFVGSNAFALPAANATDAHEGEFFSGNSFFNAPWVTAPSSTSSRDGLGPLFNASSCAACHFKDGRGAPPESEDEIPVGLLLRVSRVSASGDHLGADPTYGGQIQPFAIPGVMPEARPRISYATVDDAYPDGSPLTLRTPSLTLDELAYGPLAADVQLSSRTAPVMIGLGLLETIPAERIDALADPTDADGDGISGVAAWQTDEQGEPALGRFGWKAEQPTVAAQSAGAFRGDIGITSSARPDEDCTAAQQACADAPSGGTPEIDDDILERVVTYASLLAVPARRAPEDPRVLRGKLLFREAGCAHCHVPSHTTGDEHPTGEPALVELRGQLIWPYTDLLLHDMGQDLADGQAVGAASGREWRTPPLWGIGLIPSVNGHQYLLHDGRARGVAEAIAWHGGEAEASRDAFLTMDAEDREALIAFVNSL